MKAILEFNLPYDDLEFKHATNAVDYFVALHDIDRNIRNYLKYEEQTLENAIVILESIRSAISEVTRNVE